MRHHDEVRARRINAFSGEPKKGSRHENPVNELVTACRCDPTRGRSERSRRAGKTAALCAVLALAAPASASADPILTVLYSFKGGSDGESPQGKLFADSADNLYGTTISGGVSGCIEICGTVFTLASDGTGYQVLHAFAAGGTTNGIAPAAGLIADSAGTLYGTTQWGGGGTECGIGCGTVFKLAPDGTGFVERKT